MVAKGQFLERPTLIPVGGVVMEGLSHRGTRRPLLLVLSPTPAEGGGMDHVVGAELAWAASHAGYPTLRFNWRGVGASQGNRGSHASLIEDARAAIEVARDNGGQTPFLASIGGACRVALELEEEVAGICLVSPIEIEVSALQRPGVWVVVAERDLSEPLKVATGRVHVVPHADRTFQKNLPRVGKAVVECLNASETLQ